ncbi:MAG TPA: DUF3303 family protein [Terracidiphilus sp.]|jgi:hypothetical protein
MLVWSLKSGAFREAAGRFLAGQASPPAGITLLGRWHSTDLSIGFTLYEGDDAAAMYAGSAPWADLLDLKTHIVVEDAEVGPILAQTLAAGQQPEKEAIRNPPSGRKPASSTH